jgi:hypothetical protein
MYLYYVYAPLTYEVASEPGYVLVDVTLAREVTYEVTYEQDDVLVDVTLASEVTYEPDNVLVDAPPTCDEPDDVLVDGPPSTWHYL